MQKEMISLQEKMEKLDSSSKHQLSEERNRNQDLMKDLMAEKNVNEAAKKALEEKEAELVEINRQLSMVMAREIDAKKLCEEKDIDIAALKQKLNEKDAKIEQLRIDFESQKMELLSAQAFSDDLSVK